MEQITRDKFPSNGGWKFRQPQFGNWENKMALVGFDASVKNIINARVANKALSIKHNLSTDYNTVADELIQYNRKLRGIPDTIPSFFRLSRSRLADVAAAANAKLIRRPATGIATLADWLGNDGKPVSQPLAEQRAAICAGCPQNKPGDLTAFFTRPVADLIRRQIEERNRMKLHTVHDEKLNVCDACGCPLKLKVHVPLDFIKAHIKAPEWAALDARCWMLNEK